jgi:hypothetical protein
MSDERQLVRLIGGWKEGWLAEVIGPAKIPNCVEVRLLDGHDTIQVVKQEWCRPVGKIKR